MKVRKEISATGILRWDVELRFTPGGRAISTFQIVHIDGTYLHCQAWGHVGEHMAVDTNRDEPITVWGIISQHTWTDRDGKAHSYPLLTISRYVQ